MGGTRVYIGGLPYGVREKDLERFFKGYGRIRDILIKNGYGFVEFDDYRDADDAVYELNGKDLLGERILVQLAHASSGGYPPMRSGYKDKDSRGYSGRDGRGSGSRDSYRDRDSGSRRGGGQQVMVERARGVPRDGRGGGMGGGRDRDGGRQQMSRSSRGPPRGSGSGSDKYGPPTRTEYRLVVENLSSRVSWQDLKDYMRQAGEVTYADAHKQRRNEGVVEFATSSDLKAAIDKLDDTELNGRRIRLVEDRGRGGRSGGGRRSKSSSRSRSRSRSRRRDSRSRSKSKSKSRSKSRSKSPRSKSRSRSKSADSREKSKSRSPDKVKKEAASRSPSRSRSRSKSRDKSRSRSVSKTRDSRSRSKSVEKNGDRSSSAEREVKDEED